MIPEAPAEKDNFSEAPLVPRRLQFSDSLSLPHTPEELKMPEAPSSLLRALGKALFLLVAMYAGVEQRIQAKRDLIDQLNAEVG